MFPLLNPQTLSKLLIISTGKNIKTTQLVPAGQLTSKKRPCTIPLWRSCWQLQPIEQNIKEQSMFNTNPILYGVGSFTPFFKHQRENFHRIFPWIQVSYQQGISQNTTLVASSIGGLTRQQKGTKKGGNFEDLELIAFHLRFRWLPVFSQDGVFTISRVKYWWTKSCTTWDG